MNKDLFPFLKHRPAGVYSDSDGSTRWYDDLGEKHRNGGPAVELPNGCKYWYCHGKLHREDGPAIIYFDKEYWFYHGKKIDCSCQEEFERLIKLKTFW